MTPVSFVRIVRLATQLCFHTCTASGYNVLVPQWEATADEGAAVEIEIKDA